MVLSSLVKKPCIHRKSQSSLPTLSLNQLQKNYYLLRQRKENKNPQQSTNKFSSNLESDIFIKSPFYDRSKCLNKHYCKCQYHKKILFEIDKKYKQNEPFNQKNSVPKLKTLDNQYLTKSILNQKRYASLADQTDFSKIKDRKYYQKLITNNNQLYKQFLKKLKVQKDSNLDCYNHEFQEFLKSHENWILHDIKKVNFNKGNSSNTKGQNNRFLTAPSFPRKSSTQQKIFQNLKNNPLWMNVQDNKRNARRMFKKNTDFIFQQDKEQNIFKSCRFITFFENLKPQERSKLEAFFEVACRQIGIDYSELKTQAMENSKFFTTICKHLLDEDGKVVEKAQSILRRLSRLPFELYSTIMKQMKQQLATNFDPKTKIFDKNFDRIQESISIAFKTIEDSLGQMMRKNEESRAEQKLSILGKLKYKFVGRASISYHSRSDAKNKLRLSNIDSKKREDSQRSRFAGDKKHDQNLQNNSQLNDQSQTDQQNTPLNQNHQQNISKTGISSLGSKQQRKSIKKGLNLQKIKKNNIIKIFDKEMQFENDKKTNMPKKTNSLLEDKYLKERKQSRKRLRDQELNKHMEFLRTMKEKQNLRESSKLSQCQTKKNNAHVHYQRHKVFIQKMQLSLKKNQALKEMVINQEDDLFTKKRKVRILKNMIHHHPSDQQSDFYRDIHKYIDFFQKNCQLAISNNNFNRFNKYPKRKRESLFKNSYIQKESLETFGEFEDLMQLLRSDHNLKFYNISHVCFEEEDYFCLIKEIPTYTTEKIKNHTTKRPQSVIQNVLISIQPKVENDVLVQNGMQTKIQSIQKSVQEQECSQREQINDNEMLMEWKDLKQIKERFNNNMEKYQRIFKTQRFVNRQKSR